MLTFAAASEAAPPCLKRDHGARSSMYKFPALLISSTASQADDSERFPYWTRAFSTYKSTESVGTTRSKVATVAYRILMSQEPKNESQLQKGLHGLQT